MYDFFHKVTFSQMPDMPVYNPGSDNARTDDISNDRGTTTTELDTHIDCVAPDRLSSFQMDNNFWFEIWQDTAPVVD